MPSKGQINDIYKQLQEVINKCDNLSLEIKRLKNENKIMKEHYEKIIKEKDEKIAKLEIENDRLKKQINNNSNNSSKPPSSDIKPNKKDIPNNREKSGKKVVDQI